MALSPDFQEVIISRTDDVDVRESFAYFVRVVESVPVYSFHVKKCMEKSRVPRRPFNQGAPTMTMMAGPTTT
jgi:hypothetical protein